MTFKELLEKIGVAEDNIDNATKQFKEFLDGEYVPKSRFNEVNAEKKTLETAFDGTLIFNLHAIKSNSTFFKTGIYLHT